MAKFEPWIADCQFQQSDAPANCRSRAAVWADGPDSFRAQLSGHVQRQGLALIWVEDCYPVPHYLAKHPARQREIGPVARVVCQNRPVVLTDWVTVEGEDQQAEGCHHVIVTPVEDVEPLTNGFEHQEAFDSTEARRLTAQWLFDMVEEQL